MKRRTALLVGLCGLVGFASPAVAQQKETRIGIVTLQMKAPYFVAMVRALEAEGRANNVKTFVADGNGAYNCARTLRPPAILRLKARSVMWQT